MPTKNPTVDQHALINAVRKLTGKPVESVSTCRITSLGNVAAASATAGLWRLSSKATSTPWTIMLKIVHHSSKGHHHWMSSDNESDSMYWKREALVYESGILEQLNGPLRGPNCLAVATSPDGSIQLFLEDVPGVPGERWAVDDYRIAAYHYGLAQAKVPAMVTIDMPWLSRNWLDEYVNRRTPDIANLPPDIAWKHPLVRKAFPTSQAKAVSDIWHRRVATLSAIQRCPQTLCHLDAWPKNLFALNYGTKVAETIAIDWAYCGKGAIGEDMGNLVPDAMLDLFIDARVDAKKLYQNILEGYLTGLQESGWRGDPRHVEFVIGASSALKYIWMIPHLLLLAVDQPALDGLARELDQSIESIYEQRGATMRFLIEISERAETFRHLIK